MKPHKGSIRNWVIVPVGSRGSIVCGTFVDHPQFAGLQGRTSFIVKHDAETGEVETKNSRYTLVKPRK